MSVETVLGSQRGLIVAPAGCGKTHLIINTLSVTAAKPYLVLTHTTAGVAALKQRLKRLSVPAKNYVVTTIDGWALRFAKFFPILCPIHSQPEQPRAFYPELRRTVSYVLQAGNVNDIIQASYSHLLVDEYQDCNLDQHQMIQALSNTLPTIVFGDPMQCIFNFSGPMPDWSANVQAYFPLLATLNRPWRWDNAQTPELGSWILRGREALSNGGHIDLRSCPAHVNFQPLTENTTIDVQNQQNAHYAILEQHPEESVLVLGDPKRPGLRHAFAQHTLGLDVVEPVDLGDVVRAASGFDNARGESLARSLLTAVSEMMTKVEISKTLERLDSIQARKNRREPTPLELSLLCLIQESSRESILKVLQHLSAKTGARVYRKVAFNALRDAVLLSTQRQDETIREAASIIREQRRHQGDKRISNRAIGSTLLLKGLECDHVLILDAGNMEANHLYVALSRGAKSITAFSKSNIVGV